MLRASFFIWILLSLLILFSCGKDEAPIDYSVNNGQSSALLDVYFKSMQEFEVEVFYEEGAEPYEGRRLNGKDRWALFEKNVSSLLKANERGINLDIPKKLDQMNKLPASTKETWSAEAIYNLFKSQKYEEMGSQKGVVHVFFLKGSFEQDGVTKPSVMGVHLTDTTVIAVFKEKIKEVQRSQGNTAALFTEQSVLIHEFGHAMGLVNNGIPLQSQHHDSDHGAHCTLQSCVMYYLNEGATDLQQYIRDYITSGDEDLFGPNCLKDAESYTK